MNAMRGSVRFLTARPRRDLPARMAPPRIVTVMSDRPDFGRPFTVSTPERERLICFEVSFLPPALARTPFLIFFVTTANFFGIVTRRVLSRFELALPRRARTVRIGVLPTRETRTDRVGRLLELDAARQPTVLTARESDAC